jgi:hypothetical protein
MSEVEKTLFCENCGSSARLIFDPEEVNYEPETCPFCGELVGTIVEEEDDDDWEELDDDGLDEDADSYRH